MENAQKKNFLEFDMDNLLIRKNNYNHNNDKNYY